ncbi:MAG: lysozyme inhibitor LprI family protein [Alphaproteobacteria bacterium]|jgi:uncharacterized protein YecT (DUF1311 family)|nr:lysozyme inhibitor LprI family protein [Alphaproteobacteria bacterium]
MMKIGLVAVLLMLSVVCGFAQAADGARAPTIVACLAAAQTLDAMRDCKRIVFKACVQEPDNRDSTHGLVMCNDREGNAWQGLLVVRTAVLKKRDAYRAEALVAADAAWQAWVAAECAYHRAEAMGGSAEGVITTECISDLTADRVILLTWQLRGNVIY